MIDWTDEELKERIRKKAGNETYPVLLAELNRRARVRSTQATEDLARETLNATQALTRFTRLLALATIILAFGTLVLAFRGRAEHIEPEIAVLIGFIVVLLFLGGFIADRRSGLFQR